MDVEVRKLLAQKPIDWQGDLNDDCTACWAGLMLRAEQMDVDYWWWAVYDTVRKDLEIDSSNNHEIQIANGEAARKAAEQAAKAWINYITVM